jgi:hypothetical protein
MVTNMAEDTARVDAPTRSAGLTVTNAVWIATALLHRRYPERDGFGREEIVHLVAELNLTDGEEGSIRQHVRQHSVANKKPQPNTVCMLFDPGGGRRRLFRTGDEVYPGRNAARTHPKWDELPGQYADLRRWYEEEWNGVAAGQETDPLLALIGSGKAIWQDEPADEYVARLRSDWGDRG